MSEFFYHMLVIFFRPLVLLMYGVRYHGRSNIIKKGPVIYIINHVAFMDPVLVSMAMNRHISFVAKSELFEKPFIRWFLTKMGVIPLNRGTADVKAIKESLSRLKNNMAFSIFPEGTRNRQGIMAEFEPGAAMIALKSGAAVVPVFIHNPYKKFDGKGVDITFGKPLYLDQYTDAKITAATLTEVSAMMKEAVIALSHENEPKMY